ncbi:MAG: M14 family metallopeptidase, partial [Bacteroidia bacterium]
MKKILALLLLLVLTIRLSAQTEIYSRVRIYTDGAGIARMAAAGLPVDHGEVRPNYCLTTELSVSELAQVAQLGFQFDVLIPDLKAHYTAQNQSTERNGSSAETQAVSCSTAPIFQTPTNFTLGSMGGFFTLNEIYFHLDNMAQLYPNLIKSRVAIDSSNTTPEGRFVYYLKISDNPNVDETEPEMLYTAVHHAREPAGVSQLIMYMYYLLENYATNPEIQYLVNNTELYFIPCVNPDGYVYNETTDPNGGGMWRKNRRDNQDGTYGIDLNRNYGYNFGFDNQGSSPNTFDNTYRGPSAFSEPETQQVKFLCEQHQFRIALNYHTYGNLLICPWGYQAQTLTPDASLYTSWGALLTQDNKYAFGTADQTVGYIVNGSSDDWMYGEQNSKPKIMAMTPEAGDQADGFWPLQNRIIDICKLNLPMDLYATRLLLAYAKTKDTESRFLPALNGHLNYDVQRLGLDSPATYTVSIAPLSPWMTNVGAPRTYSSLSILQTVSDSISYTLNPATPVGTLIPYIIQIGNGAYTWNDTVTKIYGVTTILFASNGSAMTGWTSNTWNTTTSSFVSGPSSIT